MCKLDETSARAPFVLYDILYSAVEETGAAYKKPGSEEPGQTGLAVIQW